ncbi:hypothetical protein A9Q99_01400 [Gammaproteobacteria bacterium 45_16_T64]|nr:hypothetical protein A9Q99_01400 [Gammaproteobacteria bacterium 45_16_T64]
MNIYSNDRQIERCLPSRFYCELLEHFERRGLSTDLLFEGTGLNLQELGDEDYLVTQSDTEQLVINALNVTGEQNLGLLIGTKFNISAYGIAGFAALSSATAEEAMEVAYKYIPLISPAIDISPSRKADTVNGDNYSSININATSFIDEDVQRFAIEGTLSSLQVMINFVFRNIMPKSMIIELNYPLHPYHEAYSASTGINIVGNSNYNRFLFPSELLATPNPLADNSSYQKSIHECEELLQKMPNSSYSLGEAIRKRIGNTDDGYLLSQESIADELNMSPRTLHRLLSKENIKFRDISATVRIDRAKEMLKQSNESIVTIAHNLGYTDAANFTRAFKKHEGVSPSQFRDKD